MTTLDDIRRGDTRDITIDGLVDEDGVPATFGASDAVRFTMKKHAGQTDADALILKTSDAGGITVYDGTDTAVIHLLPADFDDFPRKDVYFVWDVQVALADSPTDIVTIAAGDGTVSADVTIAAP